MDKGYQLLPSFHAEPQPPRRNALRKIFLIVLTCVFMFTVTRVISSLLMINVGSPNDLGSAEVFRPSSNVTVNATNASQNTIATNDPLSLEKPFMDSLESELTAEPSDESEPSNEPSIEPSIKPSIEPSIEPCADTTEQPPVSSPTLLSDPKDKHYKYGSYKSNILPNENYFTYLPIGGTNNQLIALFHAIRIAQELNRTLIMPPIGPNKHIPAWLGPPYSTFYDLKRLKVDAGVKVVEWHEVKPIAATTIPPKDIRDHWLRYSEPLPCYIRSHIGEGKHPYLTDKMRRQMMLDVKFRMFPYDRTNGSTRVYEEFIETFSQASEHLLCVTDTYSMQADDDFIWDKIGKHLRYSPEFKTIVDEFVAFLLPDSHRSTGFLGIHLRRGDIKTKCGFDKDAPLDKWRDSHCFISIESVEEQVRKLQGLPEWDPATPVVIATNEKDERELQRIKDLGWISIDHGALMTVEDYGVFYPAMLDAAILTRSKWFLGSHKSTMSRFIANRAWDWHKRNSTLL